MRLLHTSDWHLGHTLRDFSRAWEHQAFLGFLLGVLEEQEVDALLVAGDVFEVANPPAHAVSAWFRFLADLRARLPELDVVVIGGNHDSAARLDAPNPILRALRVHVVGGVPRRDDRSVDARRMVVPITDRHGRRAFVAAVPHLRVGDLPHDLQHDPELGVAAVYEEVVAAAREERRRGEPIVAMGHLHLLGAQVSELSERKLLLGPNVVSVRAFPKDVAYVALGHLHRPQSVGGLGHVRYSGAPLPLSMDEAGYDSQVLVVDFDGDALRDVRPVPVPRAVDLVRIPEEGAASLAEVRALLRKLPARDALPPERAPFVEVDVELSGPEPTLQRKIEDELATRAARLTRVARHLRGTGGPLSEGRPLRPLRELGPEEVFAARWAREHDGPVPDDLMATFRELVELIRAEES